MSPLLKQATVEQSAAKVGIFASQGAGKTTTALLMAIGLSKTYNGGAPIAFFDTENGSDYVVPIAEVEGVQLLSVKSRAFKDMRAAEREALQAGCCAFIVDSYTHPWTELCDTFKATSKRKKLEFHHMDQLKGMWRAWTDQMLNSPMHVILAGRLGYVWDREEADEDGSKGDLVKLGTKMKSESEAGYEPSLLIEMEAIQPESARVKKTRAKQGSIVHHAYVVKDRWRTLNGRTFTFKDLNNYKAGDYKAVFEAFRPHFDKLAIGSMQRAVDPTRTSGDMFDSRGDSAYQARAKRVQIVLEEIEGTMVAMWPGQDAKSKAIKQLVVETLFATRSWTAVASKSLEALDAGLDAFKLFEETVKDGRVQAASDSVEAVKLLSECIANVAAQAAIESTRAAEAEAAAVL